MTNPTGLRTLAPQESSLLSTPEGSLQIPAGRPRPNPLREAAPLLSLVVPTYNEARNVRAIVAQLSSLLDGALPGDYEIIVVDDDSPDRTWEIAEGLLSDFPRLRVMRRRGERGLSSAVIRAWQAAEGEVLGVIDGDLQHPPDVLLRLHQEIAGGADLAVASRHVEGGGVSSWSLLRRVLSRGAQMLGLLLLPEVVGRVSDPMSGYFLVRRSAISGPELHPLGYKILLEVIARGAVASIAEIGYVFRERHEGESKVTWRQYVDYLRHLARLRRSLGWRVRPRETLSRPWLSRFVRFAAVGASGVLVDTAALFLLHDPSWLGLGLSRSKVIAAELAILSNFLWNDHWTFRDLADGQRGPRARGKRLLKFNLVCLVGLGLSLGLLNLFHGGLGLDYLLANLLAIALVTAWNFWMNLKLSWRVTAPASDADPRPGEG
jgi:dolichol-phosphate mannosyltransferase